MVVLYLLAIAAISLIGIRINAKGLSSAYLSKDSTLPVKGIFVLLIFASHFIGYVTLPNTALNLPYFQLRRFLGQLVVSPFLFYSGYGIATQLRSKGASYVRSMPLHRILKVLVQFDLALLLFFLVRTAQGNTYAPDQLILSLIGWSGIGNSNWYIFAILALYLATYLSFSCFTDENWAYAAVTLLSLFFVATLCQYKESWWYNTALTYVAGMWYARFKDRIDAVLLSSNKAYFFTLFLLLAGFRITHRLWGSLFYYELTSILFALIVAVICVKITLTSPILSYCGKHLFSLYILQRLPMLLLKEPMQACPIWLYFTLCLVFTVVVSYLFDRSFSFLWEKLFSRAAQK